MHKIHDLKLSIAFDRLKQTTNGDDGISKRNVTVVDVIKEDSSSSTKGTATDPNDQSKIAVNQSGADQNKDDRFLYDLYLVQSGQPPTEFDVSNYTIRPFDDVVYQVNDETLNGSDYDSEDSNDEANWRNDYPDTDDDLSIGEEDMRRAVEDMHFSGENESSDDEDYNYGEEPVVHFMAEQSEETEYEYFKKHGHIRNHAAFYRKQRKQRNLGATDSDDDDDEDGNDNNSRSSVSSVVCFRCYSSKSDEEKVIPKNLIEDKITSKHQPNGPIVDNKPFKIALKAGKRYSWCLCGQSKSQPLCDGTHKYVHFHIKEKPIQFEVEKDGDYWICMCRQTKHRPFCDGTHKEPHIQEKNVRFY